MMPARHRIALDFGKGVTLSICTDRRFNYVSNRVGLDKWDESPGPSIDAEIAVVYRNVLNTKLLAAALGRGEAEMTDTVEGYVSIAELARVFVRLMIAVEDLPELEDTDGGTT